MLIQEEIPLITKLENVFSAPANDLYVTLLVDSSASVAQQFASLQALIRKLVDKLNNVTVQIIQFSTTTRLECPFTNYKKMLIQAAENLKLMNGGTNMLEAFKVTTSTLKKISMTSDSVPIVFLITDGLPDNDPTSAIQELTQIFPTPKIIGIFVGDPENKQILEDLVKGPVYQVNDYDQLASTIDAMEPKLVEKTLPTPVKLSLYPGMDRLQKSKADLALRIQVKPEESQIPFVPKGTVFNFLPNDFFYGAKLVIDHDIGPTDDYEATVKLVVKPEAIHYGGFPQLVKFELVLPNTKDDSGVIKVNPPRIGTLEMQLNWLAGDFALDQDYMNGWPPLNVLIWGPMGSGKSSLINGIIMALSSGKDVFKPVTAYRSDNHVTNDYVCYSLAEMLREDHLGDKLASIIKINCWDPWGLTQTNYKKLSISHFLEGRVPKDEMMNDAPNNKPIDPTRVIDAVIMIIPIGTWQDEAMMATMVENIKTVLVYKIYPIIVVNFNSTIESASENETAFKKILDASTLTTNEVIQLDNYESEKFRNMEKDLQFWELLQKVFNHAVTNRRRRYRIDPSLLPPITTTSSTSTTITSGNSASDAKALCVNAKCEHKGKAVDTPRCGYCGDKPVLPTPVVSSKKVCVTENCENKGKEVTTPRCGYCGAMPKDLAAEVSRCQKKDCENYGVEVKTPRCAYCGTIPFAAKTSSAPNTKRENIEGKNRAPSTCA